MFEQVLGLDKSFDFDATAQKPVQNFDVFAATRNISNIAQNNNVRTAQEAAALADSEIALFDRNAAAKTQFISGNNNFSLNRLAGFDAELQQVLRADRQLLTAERDSAVSLAESREIKDEAELLREERANLSQKDRINSLQGVATDLGLVDIATSTDEDELLKGIATENKRKGESGSFTGDALFDFANNGTADVGGNDNSLVVPDLSIDDSVEDAQEKSSSFLQEQFTDVVRSSAVPIDAFEQNIFDINAARKREGLGELTEEQIDNIVYG